MKSSYASAQTAKPPNCQIRNNQLLARVTGFLLCIYGQKHWKLWLLGSVVPCFKQMVGVIPGKINSECFSPPSPFCVESQHPPLKQKQITSHPPPPKKKKTWERSKWFDSQVHFVPSFVSSAQIMGIYL